MREQEIKIALPEGFGNFISQKLEGNYLGGRPHFVKTLAKDGNAKNEVLNILELVWLKGRSIGSISRKYKTSYQTIYRILHDLDPWKQGVIRFMELSSRRKVFWNRDSETSDYETVQAYIRRAKRDGLKTFRRGIMKALKCWQFLRYKDPARWTAEDVLQFLATKSEGAQSSYLDGIRMVAPQIGDRSSTEYVSTGKFREKLRLRKKDLFSKEVNMMVHALKEVGLVYHATIFELHVTGGFREGKGGKAGITGISWDRFKKNFTRADAYESKVRGGIWCRNCPVDLFWKSLPEDLKKIWIDRGKPITEKVIVGGYPELLKIYHEIRNILGEYFKGLVDPDLYKEFITLKPHDAAKIHCNLLWEAGVPLEVVAGKYLGRGEGRGLMGRIWLDINTIKKHYLSLTERSERIQELRKQVRMHSLRFNEKQILHRNLFHKSEENMPMRA